MRAPSRSSRRGTSWLRRLPGLTAAIGLVGVLVMVVAALAIGRSSLHSAEQERLNERGRLVLRLGQFTSAIFDPGLVKTNADQTPFPRHDQQAAAGLLAQFRTGPTGDPTALASLVRRDGSIVASNPPGALPPINQLGTIWTDALAGRAAQSSALRYDGKVGWATVTPIGSGTPWAVLIVVQPSLDTSAQVFARQLGSITGTGGGGFSELDADGRALISWNPSLLGTRLLDPVVIARRPVQAISVITSGHGDQQVTVIASRTTDSRISLFQQPTSTLFADLEARQRQRDLTLLAVLIATAAALSLASLLRVRVVRRSQARLHTLLSNTGDLIVVVGAAGRERATLTLVSPTVQSLLGHAVEDWLHGSLLDFVHPDDAGRLARLIAAPAGARPLLDIRLRHRDGSHLWFDVEASDLSNDPELRGVLLTCHSVGERKALKDQLIQLGRHDPLTGLPNRLMLNRRLAETLGGLPDRPTGAPGAGLLFIDLDRFKQVNDVYGHEAGDQVLCTVAARLSALVRQHDLVCRFGGDEFGIVLQESSETAARAIAERIVQALAEPITIVPPARPDDTVEPDDAPRPDVVIGADVVTGTDNDAVPTDDDAAGAAGSADEPLTVEIGASVGIAMAGPELDHAEALLRAADGAMYRAKELGRGRAVIWHEVVGTQLSAGSALAVAPVMVGGSAPTPGVLAIAGPPEPEPATDTEALTPSVDDTAALAPQPLSTTDLSLLRPVVDVRAGSRAVRLRHRAWSLASLAAVCLAIIAVAGVGSWQTSQAQTEAEHERLTERLALTARVADYSRGLINLQRMIGPVSQAPWALDGSIIDSLVIRGVVNSDVGGGNGTGTLRTPAGRLLASLSLTAPATVSTRTSAWQAALHGVVGYQPLNTQDGQLYTTYTIPIMRQHRVAAVLNISSDLRDSSRERTLMVIGSLGFGDGGISSLELDGRASYSWNPALIGRQVVPADVIRNLPTDRAVLVKGPPGLVTLAAAIPAPVAAHRKVTVFQQSSSVFYGDLHAGDRLRDIALLLVVTVSIGLLAWTRRRQELQVRRGEQRLTALLRNAHDIVVVVAAGNATFISSAVIQLLGHDPARWLNQPLDGLVHRDDRGRLARYISSDLAGAVAASASGASTEPGESGEPGRAGAAGTLHDIRLLAADGSYRWFDLRGRDLRDHPEVAGVVFTCHEVGERKALQDELSFRARHDALTGLANRAVFTQALERLNRDDDDGAGYTVLFIDLDRFKPVNDTFGHDAGDAVLRSVAHRLGRSAAESPGSLVCRLGGDEFAVLLPGLDGPSATRLAEDILQRVRQPITVPGAVGQAVQIGATIGIAQARFADTPAAVVRRADEAMYEAKNAGRGRYAISVA